MLGAVETGGTSVRAAWGPDREDLRERVHFPTGSAEDVLERLVAFFAGAPPLEAIGVSAFGPIEVDPASSRWGHLLQTPKPGWSGVPLGPELARRTGTRVALDSDVNGAALAEARWGAGAGQDPVAYITVGTGIGLGVVVGGAPLHGLLHPEAGHLRVRRVAGDDFAGRCPYHGDCWEGMASGPAIAERWGVAGTELPEGHPAWALEVEYLAQGIAAIVLVLSPRVVVLGGGVGRREEVRAAVRARVPEILAGSLDRGPEIVEPHFEDAGLIGAFALATG